MEINWKKRAKKYFQLLLFLSCLLALSSFSLKKAFYFSISKIKSSAFSSFNEKSFSTFPLEAYQPYHLSQKGKQSFVFTSIDEKYVLKFYKKKHDAKILMLSILAKAFPEISFLHQKLTYFQQKQINLCNSLQIAKSLLKEHTGIYYLHLYSTPEQLEKITLIDRSHIAHELDINRSCFVLQKKAKLFFEYLLELKKTNQTQKAKDILLKLLDYLEKRELLGIVDKDSLIRKNFGVVDDEIIQIDIGTFDFSPSHQDVNEKRKEFTRIVASLQDFMAKNYLELSAYLNICIDAKLKLYNS